MSLGLGRANFFVSFMFFGLLAPLLDAQTSDFDTRVVQKISEASLANREQWKQEMLSLVAQSPQTSVAQIPELKFPVGSSEALRNKIQSFYSTYVTFRTGQNSQGEPNASSRWFRQERLPQRLSEIVEQLARESAPVQCPPAPAAGAEQLIKEVEKRTLPASNANAPSGQTFLSDSTQLDEWKKNWNQKKAIEFVRYLNANGIYLNGKELEIVSREENGLLPPQGSMKKMEKIEYLVIHHTASRQDFDVKGCQRDHMSRLANAKNPPPENLKEGSPEYLKYFWSDIGPHFFVGIHSSQKNWRIQAGRDPWFQGAHARPNNQEKAGNPNSIGVETAGMYEEEVPPPEALLYVYSLARNLKDQNSSLVQSIKAQGVGVEMKGIRGHQECDGTLCPGKAYMGVVTEMNRLLFPLVPEKKENQEIQ